MQLHYLIYLDILLAVCLGIFFTIDGYFFYKQQIKKQKLLTEDYVIAKEMEEFENIDIALHDGNVYEAQIHKEIENQQDLQDYITKWCHEIKIPLSACLLMNEKMEDAVLKQQIKEQLERMNQLLNAALVGCKVQSSLYDLQIKKVDVKDCVQTSIKNNRFFLIQNHFDIFVEIQDACVYSDKEWLVYVLDQLMSNAIKYVKFIFGQKTGKIRQSYSLKIMEKEFKMLIFEEYLKKAIPVIIIIMGNTNLQVWGCIWSC